MVAILIMSTKLATPEPLKIKVFWNKGYDNFCPWPHQQHFTNDYYIIDVVMWPRFGNSIISMREVIIILIFWGFDQKNQVFWEVLLVQVQ